MAQGIFSGSELDQIFALASFLRFYFFFSFLPFSVFPVQRMKVEGTDDGAVAAAGVGPTGVSPFVSKVLVRFFSIEIILDFDEASDLRSNA